MLRGCEYACLYVKFGLARTGEMMDGIGRTLAYFL
jgi:hypothetical protein